MQGFDIDKIIEEIKESRESVNIQKYEQELIPPHAMTTQEQLYEAIVAKMNIRTTKISSIRKEPSIRVQETIEDISDKNVAVSIPTLSERIPFQPEDNLYIDESTMKQIEKMLKTGIIHHNEVYEIEASFGTYDETNNKFYPGIKSYTEFANLKIFLEDPKISGNVFAKTETEDVIEIMQSTQNKGMIRCRYTPRDPENKIYEYKFRNNKEAVKIPQFGVRITTSREESTDVIPKTSEWHPHLRRYRMRTTYRIVDPSNEYYGFYIDMTIVQEETLTYIKNKEDLRGLVEHKTKTVQKYEVEIEIKTERTSEQFSGIIDLIYYGLIGNLVPTVHVSNVLINNPLFTNILFTMQQRLYITSLHNLLFEKDIRVRELQKWNQGGNQYKLYDRTYWNKPRNIKLYDLQPKEKSVFREDDVEELDLVSLTTELCPEEIEFQRRKKGVECKKRQLEPSKNLTTFTYGKSYPTVKLNGKRMFLLILKSECWMILPPFTIFKYGYINPEWIDQFDGTYLDGEFLDIKYNNSDEYSDNKPKFYAFDILFFNNKDIRKSPFVERYELVKSIVKKNVIQPYYGNIYAKVFYTEGNIYKRIRDAATEYQLLLNQNPELVDGIIVQYPGSYFNKETYKWKPMDQLTIDFLFVPVPIDYIGNPIYIN